MAWPSAQKDEAKSKDAEEARKVFESNLIKEGLNIEPDIQVSFSLNVLPANSKLMKILVSVMLQTNIDNCFYFSAKNSLTFKTVG